MLRPIPLLLLLLLLILVTRINGRIRRTLYTCNTTRDEIFVAKSARDANHFCKTMDHLDSSAVRYPYIYMICGTLNWYHCDDAHKLPFSPVTFDAEDRCQTRKVKAVQLF
ncbi:MAG: hypothetical protein DHS80DRAFT_25038 [Piptocephalis tieghemiana]|nr:MAG: hypothetical protein DHS80DRAFT_25038 [Piptocephalis tieghemiana]